MASILIKNGRIWDGNRFYSADVLTQDDKICKIEAGIMQNADYIYDATGMIVSAGLVDCHIHAKGPEPDRYGINTEMSCIPFGVTAAADAGGAHGNRELSEACLVKNVVFVKVKIADNKPDYTETEGKLRLYGDKAIGLKVYFDTTNTEVRDITPLVQICQYARANNLKVMVHCSHSPVPMAEILDTLNPGDILTHAFHGAENNAAVDDFAALLTAQKRGVIIDAGFAGHIHTDFSVFRSAIDKGVIPDSISTDITRASAYKRGGRFGMTMCMSMARTAGIREEDIFRAVTSNPARVLGKEGQWGCLIEGGCADIVVLEYGNEPFALMDKAGNVLQDTRGYRCKMTVSDGVIVWRD